MAGVLVVIVAINPRLAALTLATVPVTGMPFARALRVKTGAVPATANAWDIRPRCFSTLAARQNDVRAQLALARRLEESDIKASLNWYKLAAAQGDVDAQFSLGRLYCSGQKVARDLFAGVSWYTKACEQGDARALMTLGNLYGGGLDEMAVACFKQAAEQGIAEAQFLLGQHFSAGKAATTDHQKALMWFRRAAEQSARFPGSARAGYRRLTHR